MARVYATLSDYRGYTGDTTDTASVALLTRASLDIDNALKGALYDVDDNTGLPTKTKVIEALRDATCAQVQWWDEIGDTSGTGAAGQFQSAQLGTAAYTRGYTAGGSSAGNSTTLAPAAFKILSVEGLLPFGVWTCG